MDGRWLTAAVLVAAIGAKAAFVRARGARGVVRRGREERLREPYMEIEATIKTDDGAYEEKFNAVPYFRKATKPELEALVACAFGGDYPADAVAWGMEDQDEGVAYVMNKVRKDALSFEVHVDEAQARAWLDAVRPGWES